MFSHEIEISDSMVSNAYRHVHHADSLKYLELARLAYLESRGVPTEILQKEDIFIVVTRIDAEYLREVTTGKHYSKVISFVVEGKAILMKQELARKNNKTCIRATVHLACMSGTSRRAVPLPEKLKMVLSRHG